MWPRRGRGDIKDGENFKIRVHTWPFLPGICLVKNQLNVRVPLGQCLGIVPGAVSGHLGEMAFWKGALNWQQGGGKRSYTCPLWTHRTQESNQALEEIGGLATVFSFPPLRTAHWPSAELAPWGRVKVPEGWRGVKR